MSTTLGAALASGDNSKQVGQQAAEAALAMGGREDLKLVVVFSSPIYNFAEILEGVRAIVGSTPIVGCSSAGEFSDSRTSTESVAVATIASDTLEVHLGLGLDLKRDIRGAVAQAIAGFAGRSEETLRKGYLGRTLFLFTDGLAGQGELLIDELMTQTAMQYQLFGGAAGDDARFKETYVFHQDEILTNAFVCVEVLSPLPLGIGISHGWRPASRSFRVTKAEGPLLRELNGYPAWDLYQEFADQTGKAVSDNQASAFLMDHILGTPCPTHGYKLRVPLLKQPNGALLCAAEVPQGSIVRIMEADESSIMQGGRRAVEVARESLGERPVAGALVFECVATRLKLGAQFAGEVELMKQALQPMPFIGCNSYGQLARLQGKFSGLMDATALACVIPA